MFWQRLKKDAIMPKKATKGSAAYDAYLPVTYKLKPGRQVLPLGFAIEMPEILALDCRSRSGNSAKGLLVRDVTGAELRIDADVQLGLIDSDYRNEVGVIINVRDSRCEYLDLYVERGQAIAQLKFCYVPAVKLVEVEELSKTERTGGFGSTDKK